MLINSKSVGKTQTEILSQLSSLPSSFPEYLNSQKAYIPSQEVGNLYSKGQQLLSQNQTKQALQQFQSVEQTIPKDQLNNRFLAIVYSNIAGVQQSLGNYKEVQVNLEKSVSVSMQAKDYFGAEQAYKNLANAHKASGTLAKYKQDSRAFLENSLKNNDQSEELSAQLALASINRVQGNHKEALKHYAACYDLQQGTVDYEADRVEQHEVGFSNKKMGTSNIQQCVAVILHDPITKKTALAHVDIQTTDPKSLAPVIGNFPKDTKLNAYLVGGRDRSQQSKLVSDTNIARVLEQLEKYPTVDIKSADIGDKGAPSGIVFDPETAELKHVIPGKHHETTDSRKLLHNINLKPTLNFAFDLTKSQEIKGPEFSDLDKKMYVARYLNTPKTGFEGNEAWNANILYDPLSKVVEKIRQENPEIVKTAIKENLDYKLNQDLQRQNVNPIDINAQERQEIQNNVLKNVQDSLKNPNKTFFQIQQEMDKNIKAGTSKLAQVVKEQQKPSIWQKIKSSLVSIWEGIKNIFSKSPVPQAQEIYIASHATNAAPQNKEINSPQLNQFKQKEKANSHNFREAKEKAIKIHDKLQDHDRLQDSNSTKINALPINKNSKQKQDDICKR
jgi:tetratricopeptide (TPR) repeat protein